MIIKVTAAKSFHQSYEVNPGSSYSLNCVNKTLANAIYLHAVFKI